MVVEVDTMGEAMIFLCDTSDEAVGQCDSEDIRKLEALAADRDDDLKSGLGRDPHIVEVLNVVNGGACESVVRLPQDKLVARTDEGTSNKEDDEVAQVTNEVEQGKNLKKETSLKKL